MRKFTLLIASLFITIGAMAQTPVLHYENITSRQELSSDDANTIRNLGAMTVIADVEITNSSNPSIVLGAVADYTSTATTNGNIWALGIGGNNMRYIVRATDGGWYSRGAVSTSTAKLAYTYNYANNQTTVNYYTEGGTSQGSVTVSDAALNTFNGENAKFYIGGVGHTNSNGWYSAFAGTINSIDIYQGVLSQEEIAALCQPELPEGFVATPEEFVNGKVYTFVTQRGAMGTSATSTNAISTARTTVSDTNTDYFKWTVYKSAKGNFYLYNIGKAQFLGEQSTAGNASVPMSATPVKVTFKTTNLPSYPIMFKTTDNESCVVNHSPNHDEGLITWNGGWTNLTDTGNGHQVVAVAELDAEILSTVEAAVNAFEVDNTEAVEELDAAIEQAEALSAYIGTGVGKYTYTGEGSYEEKFAAIVAFREGITATNDPTPEAVEAKTAELQAIIASFSLNMPEAGNYYRLKGVSGNYIDATSLYDTNSRQMSMKSAGECNLAGTIFYYDNESHLLNYATGTYTRETREIGTIGYAYKSVWNITASPRNNGTYALEDTNRENTRNGAHLHDNAGNRADRCISNCGTRHDFVIEAVTELPVTISEAGFATLYAPVALKVADGVVAYTVTINGDWAILNEIESGIIPANTGVVLAGEVVDNEITPAVVGTHSFTITTTDAFDGTNALEGTVAAEYKTEDAYVLGVVDGKVGFYIATTEGQAAGTFLNNHHKAYLPASAGSANVASYSFRFGEGTTGVEKVEIRNEKSEIYDLTGRRVETITEPGIYIVNGVKKLVR